MMNQNEKELFLQLCKFCNPNAKKIKKLLEKGCATPEVLGYLFENRMAGMAYGVLEKTELLDHVDREFRSSIRNAWSANKRFNDDYEGCLRFVSRELNEVGIPYALLKGAYLCGHYPKGYRTSNDIDVLIRPDDVSRVSSRLKLAGFRQGHLKNDQFVPATREEIIASKMTRGETVPFIKAIALPYIKHLEVDLNFSLDYKNSDPSILTEMLDRAQDVTVGNVKIKTLEQDDFFLHLCAHLYKEATTMPWIRMKRDMTFYKFCDLYLLLDKTTKDDLHRIFSRATDLHLEHELIYCLYCIDLFFGSTKSECLFDIDPQIFTFLDEVISPADKKTYRYIESNPIKRFFCTDRLSLLNEVEL